MSILRRQRNWAGNQRNFIHLYLDIVWYGVLSGSAISFLAIYAVRLGANSLQIGLLNAAPAIVSLLVTLPAGRWLQHNTSISRTIFWTSVGHRFFYLPCILLPVFFNSQDQITALVILVLLMSIPGTILAVGFNALFAAAVPRERRAQVTGVRNGLLAVSFIVTSLLCGWLLEEIPFPLGYQVIFAIGAAGAALSSLHLWFVRPPTEAHFPPRQGRSPLDLGRPGNIRVWLNGMPALNLDWRYYTRRLGPLNKSLKGSYRGLLLALFFFHFGQHLAVPLFPIYWVNNLQLSDASIGLGNAVFYLAVLLTSMQIGRLAQRGSNRGIMLAGILTMSLYPALTAITTSRALFLLVSAIGGISWGLVSGALANYLLERIPENRRPSYLAWYHLALNAAVLLGAFLGPLLASHLGLVTALILIAIGRFLATLVLWRLS